MVPILNRPTLVTAMDHLEKAASASIESLVLQWPEMSALCKVLSRLTRDEFISLSTREEQCISSVRLWILRLSDGPVPPGDESTGFNAVIEMLEQAREVNGAHASVFEQIQQCVLAIGSSPHPAAAFLEDWISSLEVIESSAEGPRPGEPAVALICKQVSIRDAVTRWVQNENLFVSVESYSMLKRAVAFETIVLFGPPSRYESSKWLTSPESDFKAQWLATTPPAARVVILSWPSHPRISEGLLGPWQGFQVPMIRPLVGSEQTELLPHFEFVEQAVSHRSNFNFSDEVEVISARGYEILGDENGLWVFFDDSRGPRPRVLRGDFSETHSPSNKQALRPGTHVVFRSHEVEREQLRSASSSWWAEKYPEFSFSSAENYKDELKTRVQSFLDSFGLEEIKRRFLSVGLSKDYALQLHSRILAPDYVAPQSEENYFLACKALDYTMPPGAFNLLSKLRTARQQAGLGMLRELLLKLQAAADEGRLDSLSESGFANLNDESLGQLFISTITHVSTERALVPVSKLGRPLDKGGAVWLK